jgi:hypothetical protein
MKFSEYKQLCNFFMSVEINYCFSTAQNTGTYELTWPFLSLFFGVKKEDIRSSSLTKLHIYNDLIILFSPNLDHLAVV